MFQAPTSVTYTHVACPSVQVIIGQASQSRISTYIVANFLNFAYGEMVFFFISFFAWITTIRYEVRFNKQKYVWNQNSVILLKLAVYQAQVGIENTFDTLYINTICQQPALCCTVFNYSTNLQTRKLNNFNVNMGSVNIAQLTTVCGILKDEVHI